MSSANALLRLTMATPGFFDQRITQSVKDEDTQMVYFVVTAQKEGSNVVFSVNVGIPEDNLENSEHWDKLMDAVAVELNRITVTPQ